MGKREVSVMIRAAFDSAFKATFETADEKVKGLKDSLRQLKSADQEIKNLRQTREEVTKLSLSISSQKSAIDQAKEARKSASTELKTFEAALESSTDASRKSFQAYKNLRDEYHKQKTALEAVKKPTKDQILAQKDLKKAVQDAKDSHAAAKIEALNSAKALKSYRDKAAEAGTSVEAMSRKEKELTASLKVSETQFKRADENAKKYEASLQKVGHGVTDLDMAERKLFDTMSRQSKTKALYEREKMVSEKARDLRSGAMTNFYTALGAGYAFLKPVKIAAEFEQAMVRVGAMSGSTADELRKLTTEARRLGAETVYSAKEVASAQNNLATAGFKANEIVDVMPGLLGLADAGMSDLSATSEIAAAILRGFSFDASEMGHVADALTAAFTASSSSLESLGETMKYIAPVASAIGSSLEESLGAAALLSNVGIQGSMAGTSLRSLYLRLASPPSEAKKVFKEMGIDTKDAAGNMRNLIDIIHDVNRALEGVGTARRAEVMKKIGGEEAAAATTQLFRSEKSGAFRFEVKKYRLAPTFNELGRNLTKIPDADLNGMAEKYDLKFNRALSEGGMVGMLGKAFTGLKGKAFEGRFQSVLGDMKLRPSIADIKPSELNYSSKESEAAMRKLNVSPIGYYGDAKTPKEISKELQTAIQTLPEAERMKYIEILFSRTRNNVHELALEFSKAGAHGDELVQALSRINSVDKTRKQLSGTAIKAWKDFQGDIEDAAITLGNAVLPMLQDFGKWLKPISEGFGLWLSKNKDLAKSIMVAVGSVFAFNAGMAILKLSLSGVLSLYAGWLKLRKAGNFVTNQLLNKESLTRKVVRVSARGIGATVSGLWRVTRAIFSLKNAKTLLGAASGGFSKIWSVMSSGWSLIISLGPRLRAAFMLASAGVQILGAAIMSTPVGWILAIGAAIVAIGVGAYQVYKHWDTIKPKLLKLWGGIKSFFTGVWLKMKEVFSSVWEWIKEKLGWDPLEAIAKKWDQVAAYLKGWYEKVRPYLSMLNPFTGETFGEISIDQKEQKNRKDSGWFSDLFGSPELTEKLNAPDLPTATKLAGKSASYSQRNTITVNAEIIVQGGAEAPLKVAEKIKNEIRVAFQKMPSFSLFDPAEVS